MPGAGKSGIAEAFCNVGISVIVMGDVIRRETRKRGLDPNPENTKRVMLELREKGGPGAVASFCVEEFKELQTDTVVVEGNHYFPSESINNEFFETSDHHTVCPWKGTAHYYGVVVNGERNKNAAWFYPDTKEAANKIKDR